MTDTIYNTPVDTLITNVIDALEGQGYAFSPLTQSFDAYLATALTGIGGDTVSHLSMSTEQLLAGLANEFDPGSPLSHLTSSFEELLLQVGVRGSGDPLGPGAPVLTWDEDDSDTTPNFSVDLPSGNGAPLDAADGDVLHLQYSVSGAGIWSDYLSDALDSGEIAGDPITVTGVTPLSNGNWDFRARLERGAHIGPWSDIETATVSAVNNITYYILGF